MFCFIKLDVNCNAIQSVWLHVFYHAFFTANSFHLIAVLWLNHKNCKFFASLCFNFSTKCCAILKLASNLRFDVVDDVLRGHALILPNRFAISRIIFIYFHFVLWALFYKGFSH